MLRLTLETDDEAGAGGRGWEQGQSQREQAQAMSYEGWRRRRSGAKEVRKLLSKQRRGQRRDKRYGDPGETSCPEELQRRESGLRGFGKAKQALKSERASKAGAKERIQRIEACTEGAIKLPIQSPAF